MRKILHVEGMSCSHCVAALTKELKKIPGLNVVEVSLEKKQAVVEASSDVPDESLKNAVEEAGFELKRIE
jgi:copper ion binding protein